LRFDDITFIGKIFEIHLRGNLSLSTYSGNGTLIGNLNLLGGKLDLFGKRLNFTEGKVTFLPEFPYDPKATFKCQKNLGDIDVALEIKSSPGKGVSLNLSSTPNYSQDVILSKILFGKEIKYLSLGEAAQLANAVAGLKQNGYFFSVLNTFQSIGGIDNISFSGVNDNQSDTLFTNRQSASSKNDMNISAGKYISDNVYISVNKKCRRRFV
jgi:translocation and assembly module TamB